jgi:hypothetical protein
MALAGSPAIDWRRARAGLERSREVTQSPWARAWLALCLIRLEVPIAPPPEDPGDFGHGSADVLLTALEALAGSEVMK